MIIRKLRMVNFRGFCDKTIDFDDKPVVLISAANGIGKTTTIDAIEWCLTGEIGRLKTAFDTRSTNDTDRKKNTNGILKNRNSGNTSNVQVFLWIVDGENEIVLCREQKKDELNPDVSKVTIDGNEEAAEVFINQYVGNSFYNFHFCDVQKSFSVQNKKRGDLESLFSEFITNYDEQKQIAESIDVFADDVDRYIEDKEKQKVSQELIDSQEAQLVEAHEEANQIPYPSTIFYSGENVEIVSLSRDELIRQKTEIENCGYIIAQNKIRRLIDNDSLKSQMALIKIIRTFLADKEEDIRQAVGAGLFSNTDTISSLELSIEKLKKLTLTKDTILQDVEVVIIYDRESSFQKCFATIQNEIQEKEKRVRDLSSEIELLTNNNKILRLLSTLSVNKKVIVEHRNNILAEHGSARCPVCGSDLFATMDEKLILKEADDYIQQNGKLVKVKESEKTNLLNEIESLYEKVISQAKSIVEKEKGALEVKVSALRKLNDELKPYVDAVRKLQITRREIFIENIDNRNMENLQKYIESQILPESAEMEMIGFYQKILTVLGYVFADETLKQTYEKVKNIISESYDITDFSYEQFVTKINAIDSILANRSQEALRMKLKEERKKNETLDIEIRKLQILKNDAIQKAKSIRDIVESLSRDEYQKIGPTLSKFYNKLIRIGDNDGINIVHESDGISLIDDKGKNIVNILSNGQISVFLLAYFFAGINVRNEREKMKIFFIDDLTACMDDVNMLAFMDLLKYQISSKETMDQLFFVTCDNRISRLLKYKMNGHGIELKELLENDFKQ